MTREELKSAVLAAGGKVVKSDDVVSLTAKLAELNANKVDASAPTMTDDDFIKSFSKDQTASRAVKVSTGVTSEIIAVAEAKQRLAKGAKSAAKVLEATNGQPQTFVVDGLFTREGAKPSEWADMKGGGQYRRVPCFVRNGGLTSLQDVIETKGVAGRADVTIGAGSIIVAPAVFVEAGTELLTLIESGDNNGKFRSTVYAKGAYLMTSPFAREASSQELEIMAKTVVMATSTKVLEKAGR